LNKFYFYYFF